MRLAAAEALSFNNGNPNVPVAIDGTWQKRGQTSLNVVVTAVSVNTGKVVDAEILSRKCSCHFNGSIHSDECSENYFGNSRGMEFEEVHFVSFIAQRNCVYELFTRYREGRESVSDNPGRPATIVSDESIEKVWKLIPKDHRLTVRNVE
ncbi:uncharacterized protein TNCV_5049251 [Trichonephila clavipes]|nr:uncharacterized protein TNCV_5049251 [Trichonephila clavipes]